MLDTTQRSRGTAPRRTHAERSADTRARILAAVVECISEIGFQRTTASEIASRAGVTWGAVQHHLGGKDGILLGHATDDEANGDEGPSWQQQMGQAWDGTFNRLFGDSGLPRGRRLTLEHYVLSVLMGLAASLMLQPEAAIRPEELDLLKDTLVRELQRAG
jgi:hypothetical protein